MKRTIAITLTVAMLGSLMLMGFAGTVAAQDNITIETGDTGDVNQSAEQNAEINQQNNNQQIGTATATAASADGANHKKHGGSSGGAAAAASVDQVQVVEQSNDAEIDQDIDQEGESGDSGINIEVLLGLLPLNG